MTYFLWDKQFWLFLGKIKHRKDEKTHNNGSNGFSWGHASILELKKGQNDTMLHCVHLCPSTSGRSLGAVISVIMGQD